MIYFKIQPVPLHRSAQLPAGSATVSGKPSSGGGQVAACNPGGPPRAPGPGERLARPSQELQLVCDWGREDGHKRRGRAGPQMRAQTVLRVHAKAKMCVRLGVSQVLVFPVRQSQTLSAVSHLHPFDYSHVLTPPACQFFS